MRTNLGVTVGSVVYVRTVKTGSGAVAVQIVWGSRGGSRRIEHVGSGRGEGEVSVLKGVAQQRIRGGQQDLGLEVGGGQDGGVYPSGATAVQIAERVLSRD